MYDAIIIGGGPAGATAGFYLAQSGLKALIIEKATFPRYCIGESLLPYNMDIFREMEFDTILEQEGFLHKHGAIFGKSKSKNISRIDFGDGIESEYYHAYQVQRDRFDTLLLEHAKNKGVETLQAVVTDLEMEGDVVCGVKVRLSDQTEKTITSRVVIDASGRRFFIAKKFDLLVQDPQINNVAVFGLFKEVKWLPSAKKGDIIILAFENGWFWFIPFSDGRYSIGVVTDTTYYDRFAEKPLETYFQKMVQEASGRVEQLMESAVALESFHMLQRFSQHAKKKSGAGWVLAGDAAMFVDPVYSAGVLMAMYSGRKIAQLTKKAFDHQEKITEKTYTAYEKDLVEAYKTILPFIYNFRAPFFQRILFNPPKNGKFLALVITVLSGCFFKPELIKKEQQTFLRVVMFLKITDAFIGLLTLRPLRIRLKTFFLAKQ